jgi:hypothetical protein
MRLTPVGSPAPPWPGDDDYKPALGCWLWNPPLGELRLETNAAIFRTAVSAVWDQCRTFKEASEGLQPVIYFVDRREQLVKSIGKVFWAPIIHVIGWVPRAKIPAFTAREPTVEPPAAIDSQVRHALLEHLHPETKGKAEAKPGIPKRPELRDFLDDEIPDLAPARPRGRAKPRIP